MVAEWISTNADLILRLGLIGALVGASVSIGLREYFDWRRSGGDRLTLLDLETEQNKRQLTAFEKDSSWITAAPAHSLSTKVWEETRARLSHLLKKDEFADILKYYESVRVINGVRDQVVDNVEPSDFGPKGRMAEKKTAVIQRNIEKGLPQLLEQSDKAIAVIRQYVPKDALKGTHLNNLTFDRDPEQWGKRTS